MAIIIANSFSLSMLPNLNTGEQILIKVSPASPEEVRSALSKEFISAVGHEGTAQLLSELLAVPITFNRISIQIREGDVLIIAQLLERLPEGRILSKEEMTEFFKSGKLKFFVISISRSRETRWVDPWTGAQLSSPLTGFEEPRD